MKTKFLIAVISLLVGFTFNATAQQIKKGKKGYHKKHYRAKPKKHQGPVVHFPPAPGTHPAKAPLKPRAARLPAPPRPFLPPLPPHPGGRK